MIDVRELRVGSLIEFEGKFYPIASIGLDETVRLKSDDTTHDNYGHGSIGCYTLQKISPIPLTEDWLIKFGFEYYETDKSNVYRLGSVLITYVFEGRFKGKKYLKFGNITWPEFGHIQYVHLFQNWHAALTGKELELNSEL